MIYILLWWPSWYLLFFMHRTEGELQWVVTEKISSYGQSLTLFCSVDNCCNKTAGWSKGSTPTTIFLDFKTYSDDPNLKYGSTHNESGFGLVIRNFSETNLNKTYECAYGFQKSTHQYLLQEDVFRKDGPSTDKENSTTDGPSTDKENSTTDGPSTDKENSITDGPSTDKENSTTDEGDNTIIYIVAIVGSVVFIALVILIFCLCRRQQRKKQSNTNNSVLYRAVQQQQELLPPISERIPTLTEETNDDLQEQGGNHPDPRPNNEPPPPWCKCTHCREMPTEIEKLCCNQDPQKCYSMHQELDHILDVVDQVYRQEAEHVDNEVRRKLAHKKCSIWIHGYLGYRNRRPHPSCCVWKIREKFPDMFGLYHGFMDINSL